MSDAIAWLCYAAAAAALLLYFAVWLRRRSVVRLLNNSGLLFTGLVLGLLPLAAVETGGQGGAHQVLAVAFLLLALVAQGVAALRERRAWDGVDRRMEDRA